MQWLQGQGELRLEKIKQLKFEIPITSEVKYVYIH